MSVLLFLCLFINYPLFRGLFYLFIFWVAFFYTLDYCFIMYVICMGVDKKKWGSKLKYTRPILALFEFRVFIKIGQFVFKSLNISKTVRFTKNYSMTKNVQNILNYMIHSVLNRILDHNDILIDNYFVHAEFKLRHFF